MKQKTILHIVKNHTGPLMMNVRGPVDGMYVQVVKADLIFQLNNLYQPDEECGLEYNRQPAPANVKGWYLYLDADLNA